MTQDPLNAVRAAEKVGERDEPHVGYGQQVRGSRKGLGGDPPNGPTRIRRLGYGPASMKPDLDAISPGDNATRDVKPTCPLCHTSSVTMTTAALLEGAYWRCTRCGQMWDALRLRTAATYSRHAEQRRNPNATVAQ